MNEGERMMRSQLVSIYGRPKKDTVQAVFLYW